VVEQAIEAAGPVVVWIVDTAISAVFGLVLGLVVVAVVLGITRVFRRTPADADSAAATAAH